MGKINCNVDNCSHNSSGNCNANRVDVGGALANESCSTCCGSFLDEKNYGDLTNCTNQYTGEVALVCSAEACTNNKNKICSLDNITIDSTSNVNVYTETFCKDFTSK